MFLVIVNEAFGYTHDQILDMPMCIIQAMLREYQFIVNERNREMMRESDGLKEDEEWVWLTDFKTGEKKKIKRKKLV